MLCRIVTFITGYVTLATVIKGCVKLWYFSRVMSHCDVFQCWRFTMMLSRVISHYNVKPWFVYQCWHFTMMLSRVISHYDVKPWFVDQCWRFTMMLSRVISHYNVKPWFVTVSGWYMSTQPKMWHINNVIVGI